jgi:hypothetical protein
MFICFQKSILCMHASLLYFHLSHLLLLTVLHLCNLPILILLLGIILQPLLPIPNNLDAQLVHLLPLLPILALHLFLVLRFGEYPFGFVRVVLHRCLLYEGEEFAGDCGFGFGMGEDLPGGFQELDYLVFGELVADVGY